MHAASCQDKLQACMMALHDMKDRSHHELVMLVPELTSQCASGALQIFSEHLQAVMSSTISAKVFKLACRRWPCTGLVQTCSS